MVSFLSRRAYRLISPADPEQGNMMTEKAEEASAQPQASWCWALLPSFVAAALGHPTMKAAQVNETSYLNGLRGLAAAAVVINHTADDFFPWIGAPYVPGSAANTHYLQLPFLRLLFTGRFSVTVFFVLSGFVLAHGPLRHAHAGDPDRAVRRLPSSILRRPIRLLLPAAPVLAASCAAVWAQLQYADNKRAPVPVPVSVPAPAAAHLREGWRQFASLFRPLALDSWRPAWAPQCWTLPLELRGSVAVFVLCLVFARCRAPVRVACCAAAALYCLAAGRWSFFLFVAGLVLADVRHLRTGGVGVSVSVGERALPRPGRAVRTLSAGALVLALFLGGWPNGGAERGLGTGWFAAHTPAPYRGQARDTAFFWTSAASVLLLAALENLAGAQRVLNCRAALYLGDVSFGVYLVHWLVAYTVGNRVVFGLRDAGWSVRAAWLVGRCVDWPLIVWLGDLHWRFVDRRCVRFSRWVSDVLGV